MKRHISYKFPGFQIFFDPDTGGGGGGGGAGGSGSPEGGGGEGAGGGGGGDSDLLTMTPPDIDATNAFLQGKADAPPAPGKKDGAPAPKKDAPAPAPKKDGQTNEPPANQLRKELEATRAELADAKKRLEAGDPKVKELEGSVTAREKELSDLKQRAEDYRQRLLLHDPNVAEELVKLDTDYNARAGKFYRSVVEMGQPQVNALVQEYHRLPFNKPEYAEARRNWEAAVNTALGAQEGQDHRKLAAAIDFLEETHDFAIKRGDVEKSVRSSAQTREFEGQIKGYTAKSERIDGLLKKAGEVPDDLAKANPMHPDVVLGNFLKVLSEEDRKKLTAGVPEFVKFAQAGLKPRSAADYSGMSPEQIAESRAEEEQRYNVAQDHATKILHQGAIALRVIPSMWKEIARLRAKVGETRDGRPPDPSEHGDAGGGGGEDDDLRTLTVPDVTSLRF